MTSQEFLLWLNYLLSATDVFNVFGVPAFVDVPIVAGVPTVINISASCIYDVGVI